MLANADYLRSISDKCSFVLTIICTFFLLLLIRPLYKFSRERIPLLILFFKSCINILSLIVILSLYVTNYFLIFIPQKFKNNIFQYIIGPSYRMGLNASYLHMTILALNRFHAVFFAFSYQSTWKKRFILFISK
ncbi:hypothetical protein Mgra_00008582 [Meloidogyne graminicola]|uniref:Serpentine receptor class gamma n=1 Tax=Meloidogyne graminicola TaxID=189291 RepID=A0A8S9ZFH2_9BILA|nr:hypothetical protein Mgra_00008582 [Meloidogyne graminicola]